jgi:hypothetical protein
VCTLHLAPVIASSSFPNHPSHFSAASPDEFEAATAGAYLSLPPPSSQSAIISSLTIFLRLPVARMRPTSSKQHRPPSARRRPQRSPLHIPFIP